jgi:diacylglycerol kinase
MQFWSFLAIRNYPTVPMTPDAPNRPQSEQEYAGLPRPQSPPGYIRGRWFSFRAALSGAAHTLRSQPNARIELVAIPVVALAAWLLHVTRVEWALLGLTIAGILALEAINTGLEAVVDLVSPDYHPLAKRAKDAAAGAMVFAVMGSLWVALWVFGPYVWAWLF